VIIQIISNTCYGGNIEGTAAQNTVDAHEEDQGGEEGGELNACLHRR
jgi:hypothetical protein